MQTLTDRCETDSDASEHGDDSLVLPLDMVDDDEMQYFGLDATLDVEADYDRKLAKKRKVDTKIVKQLVCTRLSYIFRTHFQLPVRTETGWKTESVEIDKIEPVDDDGDEEGAQTADLNMERNPDIENIVQLRTVEDCKVNIASLCNAVMQDAQKNVKFLFRKYAVHIFFNSDIKIEKAASSCVMQKCSAGIALHVCEIGNVVVMSSLRRHYSRLRNQSHRCRRTIGGKDR
jgi:hypothetical protein